MWVYQEIAHFDNDRFAVERLAKVTTCVLTLNADSSVTAAFDFDSTHQVKATGGSSGYFSSIQSAYNTVVTATALNLWAIVYKESLTFNRPVSVTLEGGYDSGYTTIV